MASTATPIHSELGAVEVHGVTRSAFLLRGALAAGAVYGLDSVAPFVSGAIAQSASGDLDIVNFALTLEYLETAFYEEAAKLPLSGMRRRTPRSSAPRRRCTWTRSPRRPSSSAARRPRSRRSRSR